MEDDIQFYGENSLLGEMPGCLLTETLTSSASCRREEADERTGEIDLAAVNRIGKVRIELWTPAFKYKG